MYPIPVVALVGAVEIGHQVDLRHCEARISVYSQRIQNPGALVCAIGIRRPQVRQRDIVARESQIDKLGDEIKLRRICRRVPLA